MHHIGYYVEDKITRTIGGKLWILQAGLRFDNVAPTGIFKSKYSIVAAPRINTALEIQKGIWLRGGYGIATKSATLNYLYPGIRYLDLVNFNYFATNPAERLVVITTKSINLDDQSLKPYQSKKYELGFDVEKKEIGINVSFFQETTTGAIGINREVKPSTYGKLAASSTPPNRPPILNPVPIKIDTFFAAYDVPVNNRFVQNKGVEYNIDIQEIKAIRTSFNITGAYIQTTSFDDGQFTDAAKAYTGNTTPSRVGIYQSSSKITAERLNTSVRFIHRIPKLNIIISALWQTIWLSKSASEVLSSLPIGYITRKGETIYFDPNEQKQSIGITGTIGFVVEENELGFYGNSGNNVLLYRLRGYGTFSKSPFVSGERKRIQDDLAVRIHYTKKSQNTEFLISANASQRNDDITEGVALPQSIGFFTSIQYGGLVSFYKGNFNHGKSINLKISSKNGYADDVIFRAESASSIYQHLDIQGSKWNFNESKKSLTQFSITVNYSSIDNTDQATRTKLLVSKIQFLGGINYRKQLNEKYRFNASVETGYSYVFDNSFVNRNLNTIIRELIIPNYLFHSSNFALMNAKLGMDIISKKSNITHSIFASTQNQVY